MKRQRKNYSANEKVAILKRHLVDKVSVSDLCCFGSALMQVPLDEISQASRSLDGPKTPTQQLCKSEV